MKVIYGLLPFIIVIGLAMVGVLFWAVKSGQYDDLEGPAGRILMDEDDPLLPRKKRTAKKKDRGKNVGSNENDPV